MGNQRPRPMSHVLIAVDCRYMEMNGSMREFQARRCVRCSTIERLRRRFEGPGATRPGTLGSSLPLQRLSKERLEGVSDD